MVRNTVFMTVRFVFVLFINLYVTRAILDVLGVTDFGIYSVVAGFVSMFGFLNISMSNGIQRFYNFAIGQNKEEDVQLIYTTALLIQGILALIIIAAAESFGLWYIQHHLVIPPERHQAAVWIFHMAVASFGLVIMQSPFSSIIMAHEKMDYFALVSVLDAVFKLLIVIGLPYLVGDRLVLYGILLALVSVIDLLLYSVYAKIHFREIRVIHLRDKRYLSSIMNFSGWNIFGSFAYIMREQGVDLLMNLFYGPVVNAARGIAAQVNGGIQSFISNMTTAIRPQLIQSYAAGEINRSLQLMFTMSKVCCAVVYLMAVPIMLEIDFILDLWLKGNVPDHTVGFLLIIILISIVSNLNYAVSSVIHASGQMRRYQVVTSVIALSSLPMAYILLKLGGTAEQGMMVILIFMCLMQAASVYILKQIVPELSVTAYLKDIIGRLAAMAVLTLPALYALHNMLQQGWTRLFVVGFISVLCIMVVAYWVVLNRNEKQQCNKLIKSIIRK